MERTKRLFRTLVYWIFMARFLLFMCLNIKRLEKFKSNNEREKFNELFHKGNSIYCDAIFKSSKSSFEVFGREKIDLNETYLLVSNHLSIVDIASIVKAFPKEVAFVSKKELSNIILFSKWLRTVGCIFLDRENTRNAIKEISKGIEVLKNGTSMCIFPEGTRGDGKTVGDFKKGSFKLALKSNVKILPTVLVGTRNVYEENNRKIRKGDIKVIFLDPLDPNHMNPDEIGNLNIDVRNMIEETYKKFI